MFGQLLGLLWWLSEKSFLLFSRFLTGWTPLPQNDEGVRQMSPEVSASWISRLVFWWLNPLMLLGNLKILTQQDLYVVQEKHTAKSSADRLEIAWRSELDSHGFYNTDKFWSSTAPSLGRAMWKTLWKELFVAAIPRWMKVNFSFVAPVLLQSIVSFVSSDKPLYWGLFLVLLLFIGQTGVTLSLHQYWHWTVGTSVHARYGVGGLLYRKLLKLSIDAKQQRSTGEILNMVANDTQRMQEVIYYIHFLWATPYLLTVCFILLYRVVGLAALAGFVVLFALMPIGLWMSRKTDSLRKKLIGITDERVKFLNEILQAIRAVKLFALEACFGSTVAGIRSREMRVMLQYQLLRGVNNSLNNALPILLTVTTFVTYGFLPDSQLDAAKAFSVLALYNLTRFPFSVIGTVTVALVEGRIAIVRMQQLLLENEVQQLQEPTEHSKSDHESDSAVVINHCDFGWSKGEETKPETTSGAEELTLLAEEGQDRYGEATLKDISLSVKRGDLAILCGEVGSGKSSLLLACLGEMYKRTPMQFLEEEKSNEKGEEDVGSVKIGGRMAFVGEEAWVLRGSVRDNILFGLPYDGDRYKMVLDVCALNDDLAILPAGDETEIGERGINLSGGQKQRISLARAVYSDADIYLLDDPLSAVDLHVGKHIFETCIMQALKNKTRMLVTHHLQYLPYANQVIIMRRGEIVERGSYADLINSGMDFAGLLTKHGFHDRSQAEDNTNGEEGGSNQKGIDNDTCTEIEAKNGDSSEEGEQEQLDSKRESEETESSTAETDNLIKREEKGKLVMDEDREQGAVKLGVYLTYFREGGYLLWVIFIVCFLLSYIFRITQDWWLAYWSELSKADGHAEQDAAWNISIYAMLACCSALLILFRELQSVIAGWFSARNLHLKLIRNILPSPMEFFDRTPIGRIVSRLSGDTDVLDTQLAVAFGGFIDTVFMLIGTIIIILLSTLWFLLALPPLLLFYFGVQQFYRSTARELKRLDSITKSPMFALFSETSAGLIFIRAYRAQARFITLLESLQNENIAAFWFSMTANRWLAVRLEMIGILALTAAALLGVLQRGHISPELLGLGLAYAIGTVNLINDVVRNISDIENRMNSTERILHYVNNRLEAPPIVESNRPPQAWPMDGCITMKNVTMRYREGLPTVLNGINCDIRKNEKIGIVGRTGAGKSSLLCALFRLVELSAGEIIIDGIDISTIGLDDLRSKIAIIPQHPILFQGTVRFNLDPAGDLVGKDEEIWEILDKVHLRLIVEALPGQLDFVVLENGENFSLGQRQLFCIARALLRRSKIMVLDEATAGVDLDTDALIQQTVRKEFANCTVLTIAHRLSSIIDSDRIMVLAEGKIVEFYSPTELLKDARSAFAILVSHLDTAAPLSIG